MFRDLKAFMAAARRFPAERIALFRKIREIHEGVSGFSASQSEMLARMDAADTRMTALSRALEKKTESLARDAAAVENRLQSTIGAMAQEVNATFNFAHLQQAASKTQDTALSELKTDLTQHQKQLASLAELARKTIAGLAVQDEAIRSIDKDLTAKFMQSAEDQTRRFVNETHHVLESVEKETSARLDAVTTLLNEQEARQGEQLGRIANEVNAALNAVVGQQASNMTLTGLVSSSLSNMSSQQDILGGMANDLNATLSSISGQQAALGAMASDVSAAVSAVARHHSLLGPLANDVTTTLSTVTGQQSLLGPLANDVNAALSAVKGQQALLGPMANELNAALNSVMAQQSAQSAIIASLSRIETEAARERDRTMALNLLVGRGTAAVIRRQSERRDGHLPVLTPVKPPSIAKQIETLGKLAPHNINSWVAAYKAGIAEGERSVEGNLSHDGHMGAGYFRFFINVHGRGRLLDFGCGPLAVPAYLADWPLDQLAGFDPQKPFAPHPFPFAQSLGETVPWPDHSFETVVIATSLDHVYLLDKALAEVKRVLVPGGRLLVWTALLPESAAYDPYGPTITPPDEYHLFHPGQNWFHQLFASDYDMIERMETVAQAEMLAYQLKP